MAFERAITIELEPRHEALRETARAAAAETARIAERAERPGAPGAVTDAEVRAAAREIVARLGAAGLLAVAVPAADGAAGIDLRALCVAREELAYRSGLADALLAVQGLGAYPIHLAGEESLRRRFLPDAAAGRTVGAFAVTEPDAGSNVAAIATVARRDGDLYRLDGEKIFISNAGIADFYVVFARTSPPSDAAAGHRGLSAFVVAHDALGAGACEPIELSAPHPIGRITLRDVRVPASQRLGAEGDGFRLAMATLDVFRASVGAAACGLAGRALDEALERAGARRQFGRPIAEHQSIQAKLAEMATSLDAARALVYRAATLHDRGAARSTCESAMAKLFATEAAQRVVDESVQIFGGAGVVRGAVVERLYREVRALRIYEGTSEIQRLIIARELVRGRAARKEDSGGTRS